MISRVGQLGLKYEYGIFIRMMPEHNPQYSILRAPWIPPQPPTPQPLFPLISQKSQIVIKLKEIVDQK